MFHPKVWILSDNKSSVVAHGSSNPTEPGLLYNYEIDMAGFAKELGRKGEAADWTRRAAARKAAINRLLWDPGKAVYTLLCLPLAHWFTRCRFAGVIRSSCRLTAATNVSRLRSWFLSR